MGGDLPTTLAPQTGLDLFRAMFDSAPADKRYAITEQDDTTPDMPYLREFMLSKSDILALGKPSVPPVKTVQAVVATAKLNVRSEPRLGADGVVAQLDRGASIKVEQSGERVDEHEWLRIADGPYTGRYVAKDMLSFPLTPA